MTRLAIVVAAVLVSNAAWAQPQYDLLLKGGHVIDPRSDINRRMDVAITAGKIARVADTIAASEARRVVDVSGLFVTPGLVDIHVHVYTGADVLAEYSGDRSLPPDGLTFRSGLDAETMALRSWCPLPRTQSPTRHRATRPTCPGPTRS